MALLAAGIVALIPITQNDQLTITIVMAGRALETHHHHYSYHDFCIIMYYFHTITYHYDSIFSNLSKKTCIRISQIISDNFT